MGFGAPTLTKTNSWMMSFAVVDDSLPLPTPDQADQGVHTITVNMFHNSRQSLPKFNATGDVIRLNWAVLQV